jgi:oligopeptide/dipeptide ABC transporter ATP-binding protein
MEEPLKIHNIGGKKERIKRVDEVLNLVGLNSSYKSRRVQELSGGQKQRVCIACALMLNPQLIIADEAISSLDVSVGAQILNLFQDLHDKLGLAFVFISHNLKVIYYLCDRICVMYNGEIVELGSADDVYGSPAHPYTKLLLNSSNLTEEAMQDFSESKASAASVSACHFANRCLTATSACKEGVQRLFNISVEHGKPHWVRCNKYNHI